MSKLTTYEGIIENGHVTLASDTEIPDNTRGYVMPDDETQSTLYVASPRLVHPEQAKVFEMEVAEATA